MWIDQAPWGSEEDSRPDPWRTDAWAGEPGPLPADATDPQARAFARRLQAEGGSVARLIGEVVFRATLDPERGGVIFSARSDSGPWAIAYAEAFVEVGEAFFEGWCMDAGQWIDSIDNAEAALAMAGGELIEREEALRATGRPVLNETAADFWRQRPSRRGPAG